jgi:hypothetical protein
MSNDTLKKCFPGGEAFSALYRSNSAFYGLFLTFFLFCSVEFFYWYFTEENIGGFNETRGLFFQEPANAVMEGIIDFHHDLFFILIVIVIFVCFMLYKIIY